MGEVQLSLKDEHREQYCNHNSSISDVGGVRKEGKKGRKYILDENMEFGFQAFTPIAILLKK